MIKRALLLSFIGCAAFAGTASQSGAAVIVDSLIGSAIAGNEDTLDSSGKAVAFTMGSSDYRLDSLTLRLRRVVTNTTVPTMTLAIYSTTEISPGEFRPNTQLVTFENPVVNTTSTSSASYTVNPTNANFTLAANTTYWIVAYITNAGSQYAWKYNNGDTDTYSGGVTVPDISSGTTGKQTALSFAAGNTLADPSTWTGVNSNFNDLELNATLIPEPSAMMLLAASAGVLGIRRRP